MIVHKAITRVELYDAVFRKAGLSRPESAALTESVLKEISDCIVRGETGQAGGFWNVHGTQEGPAARQESEKRLRGGY